MKKYIRVLSLGLSVMLSLSGCSTNKTTADKETSREERQTTDARSETQKKTTTEASKAETVSTEKEDRMQLVMDLKQKYAETAAYHYTGDVYTIGRTDMIQIPIGFDPAEKGVTDLSELIGLYQTKDLVSSAHPIISYNKEEKCIQLESNGAPIIYLTSISDSWWDQGWGNLEQMYIAQNVDFETGEKLSKPMVSVVRIKGELDSPKLTFSVTEDGNGIFNWDQVRGAEEYCLVRVAFNDETYAYDNLKGYVAEFDCGITRDTVWEESIPEEWMYYDVIPTRHAMNLDFSTYKVSLDDWIDQPEMYREQYGADKEGTIIPSKTDGTYYYGVVALKADGEGCSMMSNLIDQNDIAKALPHSMATYNGEVEELSEVTNYSDTIAMLPSYEWIVMCDGSRSSRLIHYRFEEAITKDGLYLIPYELEGTVLEYFKCVTNQNPDTLEADCQEVTERQDKLRSKGGGQKNVTITTRDETTAEPEETTTESEETTTESEETTTEPEEITQDNPDKVTDISGFGITANSALSEYLAQEMLAGKERIGLAEFPETTDMTYLLDAWEEAYTQNPLILGVNNVWLTRDGQYLEISYEDSLEERTEKQQEILDKVNEITASIIEDDMTPVEKELAINEYLCDNGRYDDDALENAKQYNYEKADARFNDSFTPYGILVKGVGVCASYASSFKLLADSAGLNSVIVTGSLNGTISHAWNRVELDGNWPSVDVTNNDNELMNNAILNLPDSATTGVLVEDDGFVMDSVLDQYTSSEDSNEFYRLTGNYYETDEIVSQFVEQLGQNDVVVLRTDYSLDDKDLNTMGETILNDLQAEHLRSCNWLGVIRFERVND